MRTSGPRAVLCDRRVSRSRRAVAEPSVPRWLYDDEGLKRAVVAKGEHARAQEFWSRLAALARLCAAIVDGRPRRRNLRVHEMDDSRVAFRSSPVSSRAAPAASL